jgi:C-methyltransferase
MPMEPLMELIGGALAFTVLRAAVEVGVFDHLAGGTSEVASIARELKADERGTRLLLDALTAMGMLESGDGYRLSPLADATLVSGRPGYFGGLVRWMGGLLHQAGPHMADAVRRGGTVLEEDVLAQLGLWEEFAGASAAMAGAYAEALADIMAPFLAGCPGAIDIFDVACGSGLYGLTLAGRHPAARVTLNDWAEVLERTRATVDRLGPGRAQHLPGRRRLRDSPRRPLRRDRGQQLLPRPLRGSVPGAAPASGRRPPTRRPPRHPGPDGRRVSGRGPVPPPVLDAAAGRDPRW